MDATELAHRSIQEAFSRSVRADGEDAYDRRDRQLAASLRRVAEHFPDRGALAAACSRPLTPFSPCLPLPLACHLFAGSRGNDYPSMPDCCKALLDMGADPFARSAPPEGAGERMLGRYMFGSEELNAFEIALARSDAGLILAIAPSATMDDFLPQHWTGYEIFCELPEPLRSRCDEVMHSLAERGFFLSMIDAPGPADGADGRAKRGGKRL